MFQPGDLVVYGTTGVCQVVEITRPNMRGIDKNQEYYLLRPLQQDGVVYAPVGGENIVMRPVISCQEAEELIDIIPTVQAEIQKGQTLQALAQHYQSVMKNHSCTELVELVKSIYAKRQLAESQNRRLGLVDERYMKQAERLLYGELAAALNIPFDQVAPYIASRAEGAPPLVQAPEIQESVG